jgi:hypothetical protein
MNDLTGANVSLQWRNDANRFVTNRPTDFATDNNHEFRLIVIPESTHTIQSVKFNGKDVALVRGVLTFTVDSVFMAEYPVGGAWNLNIQINI